MKIWLRWLLLTISVGGGFEGLILNLHFLALPEFQQPTTLLVISLFTILYGFVFVAGLFFADDPNNSTPLLISLCLQIPTISSPIVIYRFLSGFPIVVSMTNGEINMTARFGGEWQFNLHQELPWGFGINLYALICLILLLKYRHRNRDNSATLLQGGLKKWFTTATIFKN